VLVTTVFHRRYIRTQREFLITRHPWGEFLLITVAELMACAAVAVWVTHRIADAAWWEVFVLSFGAATLTRYILRKELMQDIRGLRKEIRREELI
jgi:hypothetical protein